MEALRGLYEFVPSHVPAGDGGTTLAFRFESEAEARAFNEKIDGTIPFDTGKHVYTNWTPVMQKRGAFHPAMDPFQMPANRELNHNYSMDMCPETLGYLRRTVYLSVNPDWTESGMEGLVKQII
jgi:hypothetical protein